MSQTPQIDNAGSCIATATAIDGPGRIRWMLRTPSAIPTDSGWRFYATDDDEENVAHTTRLRVVDFNQVAALDPIVTEVYNDPVGSDYEVVTTEDGQRQIRDAATGEVVAGPGREPQPVVSPEPTAPAVSPQEPAVGQETQTPQPPAAEEPVQAPAEDGIAPVSSGVDRSEEAASAPRGNHAAPVAGVGSAPVAGSGPAPSAASATQGGQDAAVAASANWLRPAVQEFKATQNPTAKTALLSELYGAAVFVPVTPQGSLAAFENQGKRVVPVHTSRQGAEAWQQRLGTTASFEVLNGDEALTAATDEGAQAIVIDPVEVGVELSTTDQFIVGFSRNGQLKQLVRNGDKAALLDYLVSPEASGVYLYQALPGQPAYPLLVTRQEGGEREFALFSSALEVFRYQDAGSAADIPLSWIRANLAEDMFLCIDPGAQGGFAEFSPQELAAVGFRTA